MNCSLSGFSVHGISQARILEWVAISFSKGSSWPRDWTHESACQADSLPVSHLGNPSSDKYLDSYSLEGQTQEKPTKEVIGGDWNHVEGVKRLQNEKQGT